MSCTCRQPVRPEFKSSYKDLLDKPKINGVPLDGDMNTDNLHINYPHLANLPQINGVTLDGNLTAADLGIKAGAQFKIVAQLPVTDIDETTVYLVPVQVGQADNIYQEWIYINNKWEKIGEPINIQGGGEQQIFFVDKPIYLKESGYYDIGTLQNLNSLSLGFTFRDNAIYKLFLNPDGGIYNTIVIPALSDFANFHAVRNIPESEGSIIDIATQGVSSLVADEIIITNGSVFIGGYISFSAAYFPGLAQ